jgi:lysophospholipase L1-like esterase
MDGFVRTHRARNVAQNAALLLATLLFCFAVLEGWYRTVDPFPNPSSSEINHTEYGNLSEYDDVLGWKGVPLGQSRFVTGNNSVWLRHNESGFRDIEHPEPDGKPAMVFLGDSFTWGYEVEFEEMFVNRLRGMFPGYEVFNLAHRGYGTDQELLTFQNWQDQRPLALVILMFSENDVEDNNRIVDDKPKPKFELVDGDLVLTGVPVPRVTGWTRSRGGQRSPTTWKNRLRDLLYRSHAVADIVFRSNELVQRVRQLGRQGDEAGYGTSSVERNKQDLGLTARILEELAAKTDERGAKFVVAFVPSKLDVDGLHSQEPYQVEIARLCEQLGIEYVDLLPDFRNSWYRTYYRRGMHWNARGHEVAARGLNDHLRRILQSVSRRQVLPTPNGTIR